MSSNNSANFIDFVQSSGLGASQLFGSGNGNQPAGYTSGDLFYFSETGSARGGNGPPSGGGGGGGGGGGEVVTDTYITGQNDNIDDSLQYNIEIQFLGVWPDDLKAVFVASANYLASLIAEDIPDAVDGAGNVYDDLVIIADLAAIDGVGGVLGQAGPTGLRTDTGLPAVGEMTFDEADAREYFNAGLFDDIVVHEMLHVMGFGTLWDYNNLVDTQVDTQGTKKPIDDIVTSLYTGDAANSAFVGYTTTDDFILVETDGGSGTAGGHWDEETYFDELMTGYIGYLYGDGSYDSTNYLSDWSIAALTDLGYALVADAAGIPQDVVLV